VCLINLGIVPTAGDPQQVPHRYQPSVICLTVADSFFQLERKNGNVSKARAVPFSPIKTRGPFRKKKEKKSRQTDGRTDINFLFINTSRVARCRCRKKNSAAATHTVGIGPFSEMDLKKSWGPSVLLSKKEINIRRHSRRSRRLNQSLRFR
jgi:hypothetical protein